MTDGIGVLLCNLCDNCMHFSVTNLSLFVFLFHMILRPVVWPGEVLGISQVFTQAGDVGQPQTQRGATQFQDARRFPCPGKKSAAFNVLDSCLTKVITKLTGTKTSVSKSAWCHWQSCKKVGGGLSYKRIHI